MKIHNQLIVSILLFADDIALIADSEEHLQRMLDFGAHRTKSSSSRSLTRPV